MIGLAIVTILSILIISFWAWLTQQACFLIGQFKPSFISSFLAVFILSLLTLGADLGLGYFAESDYSESVLIVLYSLFLILQVIIATLTFGIVLQSPDGNRLGFLKGFFVGILVLFFSFAFSMIIA